MSGVEVEVVARKSLIVFVVVVVVVVVVVANCRGWRRVKDGATRATMWRRRRSIV